MRITFVLPYAGVAGGIRVVAIYADRLQRRGHDVFVVSTPSRPVPWRRKVKSFVLGRGWPMPPAGCPYFQNSKVSHRIIDRVRAVTDSDVPDADVVVATWWETAEWVAALSPGKGSKAYFIQHDEQVMYGPDGDEMRQRSTATWSLPMHKITIAQWLVDLAYERSRDTNVSHVPNSVDTEQFRSPPRRKQELPTVGLLYATARFKGVDVSLRALQLARLKVPRLRLVAFGVEQPIEDLALPPGAEYHLRPSQDSIRGIYGKCDVWLCGSRAEGFHLPPLEAMACRCPVVSTRVGGPMDIVQEGVNGHLTGVEDSELLADRLARVLMLPEAQWLAMSDAAYATATRYTWDDATSLFERSLEVARERDQRGVLGRAVQTELATI